MPFLWPLGSLYHGCAGTESTLDKDKDLAIIILRLDHSVSIF
jgi:hypothetical protein